VTQVADLGLNFALRGEQVVPESELVTELETAGSSHHLHKIDLEVP
jgi:hypothetical protein